MPLQPAALGSGRALPEHLFNESRMIREAPLMSISWSNSSPGLTALPHCYPQAHKECPPHQHSNGAIFMVRRPCCLLPLWFNTSSTNANKRRSSMVPPGKGTGSPPNDRHGRAASACPAAQHGQPPRLRLHSWASAAAGGAGLGIKRPSCGRKGLACRST